MFFRSVISRIESKCRWPRRGRKHRTVFDTAPPLHPRIRFKRVLFRRSRELLQCLQDPARAASGNSVAMSLADDLLGREIR